MLIHSPSNLAQFYRDQRKLQALSQVAIAEEVGMRQDTVSKFELKPENVRLDTLFRLLAALDMELHLVPRKQGGSGDSSKQGWHEQW